MTALAIGLAAWVAVAAAVGVLVGKVCRRRDEATGLTQEMQDAAQAAWLDARPARRLRGRRRVRMDHCPCCSSTDPIARLATADLCGPDRPCRDAWHDLAPRATGGR